MCSQITEKGIDTLALSIVKIRREGIATSIVEYRDDEPTRIGLFPIFDRRRLSIIRAPPFRGDHLRALATRFCSRPSARSFHKQENGRSLRDRRKPDAGSIPHAMWNRVSLSGRGWWRRPSLSPLVRNYLSAAAHAGSRRVRKQGPPLESQ